MADRPNSARCPPLRFKDAKMYAVIKTGGKQYRVQPGDVLIVEKLDGDAGSEISFDQVLAMGEGADVTLGAPMIEGAFVKATLIETRKGEKVKIFKKIRRQGYRRTKGHRQPESVLRVTSIGGKGKETKWDGEVDLTTRATLNARARGFKDPVEAPAAEARPAKAAKAAKPAPKAAKEPKGALVEQPISEVEAGQPETVAAEKPAKKAVEAKPAPKAAEPKKAEAAPKKAAAPKADGKKTEAKAAPKPAKAQEAKATETKSEAAPAKKPAAKKAKPADGGKA
jgi:large subunit ribosomal protein L21